MSLARLARQALAGTAMALAAALAAGLWLSQALGPVSSDETPVDVRIPEGATLDGIARELESAGVVRHAWAFGLLARWRSVGSELRAGEYALAPSAAATEILDDIVLGRVRTHRVVIPEGLTAVEIAGRLEETGLSDRSAFLAAVEDPALVSELGVEGETLEGYLYPETYQLARGLPADEVAAAMVSQFQIVWIEIAEAAAVRGLSMKETVTLASIIEKETGSPQERPLIASVFHNRLERGMRLETDPTVIYGIPDFDGNLRRSHLEDRENPYNTYQIAGLPPGPIASPGGEALRAAVHPEKSEYLFFVSRNDGTHHFSRTYREHSAAVDRFQRGGR